MKLRNEVIAEINSHIEISSCFYYFQLFLNDKLELIKYITKEVSDQYNDI